MIYALCTIGGLLLGYLAGYVRGWDAAEDLRSVTDVDVLSRLYVSQDGLVTQRGNGL